MTSVRTKTNIFMSFLSSVHYTLFHFILSLPLDEFRSKVACENDVIQLMCNPYSRIAIYGATYGRAEYESLQCAQPNGSPSRQEHVERKLNREYSSQQWIWWVGTRELTHPLNCSTDSNKFKIDVKTWPPERTSPNKQSNEFQIGSIVSSLRLNREDYWVGEKI